LTGSSIPKGVVKDIVIVAVGVLIVWLSLVIIFGTQNPFYVVSSGSMIPELEVYDVLVVQGNEPFEDIDVGDIIVFNRPSGHDRVIVHRVASIIEDDPKTIRTKGDANPSSIPGTDYPVTEEEYIGKVAYVIPQIGFITRILMPPVNYVIIAVIIGIMIFKQYTKNKKEKEKKFFEQRESSEDDSEKKNFDDELSKLPKDNEYVKTNEKSEPEKIDTQEQEKTSENLNSDENKKED